MPELPEVEATRDNLARWTTGRVVVAVATDPPGSDLAPLIGHTLLGWRRRGKRLAGLTSAPVLGARTTTPPVVLVQLGMTGRLVKDAAPDRPHQRVRLTLDDGSTVALVDTRRLGRVALCRDLDEAFAGLGPDALTDRVDGPTLGRLLGLHRKVPIMTALMDQARIAGLGNIAVLEACFRAGMHPHRSLDSLGDTELARLAEGIAAHLEHTLATTLGHDEIAYVSEGGENPFLVYGREGSPCPRCEGPIARVLASGRPSFWCPACQC